MHDQKCRECNGPLTLQPSPRSECGRFVYAIAMYGCNRCDARKLEERAQRDVLEALQQANGLPNTEGDS